MIKTFLVGVAALLSATTANAAVVLFSDFDSIVVPGSPNFIIIPMADGWTGAPDIEIQAGGVGGTPFSAPNLVELDTTRNSSMFVALGAGSYSVSYYYSPRPGVAAASNGITLSIGSTLLDSVALDGGSDTMFGLRTVNFTTTGDLLSFAAIGTSDGLGGYLDDITISTTAVPEASTWALMIAGFGMVGFAARRRRDVVAA